MEGHLGVRVRLYGRRSRRTRGAYRTFYWDHQAIRTSESDHQSDRLNPAFAETHIY